MSSHSEMQLIEQVNDNFASIAHEQQLVTDDVIVSQADAATASDYWQLYNSSAELTHSDQQLYVPLVSVNTTNARPNTDTQSTDTSRLHSNALFQTDTSNTNTPSIDSLQQILPIAATSNRINDSKLS